MLSLQIKFVLLHIFYYNVLQGCASRTGKGLHSLQARCDVTRSLLWSWEMPAEAVKMRVQADFYFCMHFCTKMETSVQFSKGSLKPGEIVRKIQGQEKKKKPEHERHRVLSLFNLSK